MSLCFKSQVSGDISDDFSVQTDMRGITPHSLRFPLNSFMCLCKTQHILWNLKVESSVCFYCCVLQKWIPTTLEILSIGTDMFNVLLKVLRSLTSVTSSLVHWQMMEWDAKAGRGSPWRKCHLDRGGNMRCSQLFLNVRYGMDRFSNRLLCVVFPL